MNCLNPLLKSLVIIVLVLFFVNNGLSQNESNIWYFGYNAGLDFNTDPPTPLLDGQLSTWEGCATVSNSNGELLFYTDGMKVYNRNHQIMPNGSGLLGNMSATQSGIVVPFPGTYNVNTAAFDKYFIVTIDQAQGPNGVRYSEVDLTLNGGLGDITSNINIPLYGSTTTEKICVAKHANGCDYWVIGKPVGVGEIYAFPITSSGFNTNPVISPVSQAYGYWSGTLKASPDNKMIAATHGAGNGLYVYDFNSVTGILTEKFSDIEGYEAYGVEFSPDSKLLYYTHITGWDIFQYKLDVASNAEFVASKQIIGTTTNPFSYHVGALQLAPNGKIYVALPESNALGIIENPNNEGISCSYLDLAQPLGGRYHYLGLPTFVTSLVTGNGFQFQDTSICAGEILTFPNPGTSGYWTNANNEVINQPLNTTAGVYTFYPDCGSPSEWRVEMLPCPVPEICDNGIDDDFDGFVDGFDPDCSCLNNEWFNICTPACQSIPETQPFAMQQQWVSTQNVPGYSTPLVGDLNADGIPEVVIQGTENIYMSGGVVMMSKNILVLNGIDGSQISSFETPYADFEVTSPIVIVDIDNNGQGEIILASSVNVNAPEDQTYLYCYDINGNLLWKSDSKYGVNSSNYSGGTLGVADFNHDGTAEVYVFNEIFNAQTGIKLVDGGNNGIGHMYYPYPSLGLFSQTVAVDLTSHPGLELAAGKTVYEVNITNTNGTTGNTMTAINSPNGRDGFTSIADMDLDGELDVIVADQGSSASSLLYVWNPRTISIIASTAMPTNAGGADAYNVGVPVIGDMDGDGTPEIGVVRPRLLLTYKYNGSTTLSQFWSLATDDQSGVTKLSIFDFNQDGMQEIVYRDQSQLRILDGATSNTLTATPLISCTAVEGPVVADIDGDGEAEILIVGDVGFCSNYGLLYAFGSGSAAWAPARKVWNQYAYFNVNINDNLTVPQQQQNHGLQFYQSLGNCAGASLRPLNSFMMQETVRDVTGCPIFPANITNTDTTATACQSFVWYGTNYTTTGDYTHTLLAQNGCDSIVTLHLTINLPSTSDTTATACQSFSWHGNSYSNSGDYLHILTNSVGCDSTVTLHLTIFPTSSSDTIATTCESFTWYGTTYTQSGNYTHTLQSIYGCDSVVTLQLTISNSIQTLDIQEACNSFTWMDGNTYTQSTSTPFMTYQSVSGCDSVVTLQLTIHNSVTVNTDATACSSFIWNGTSYTSSGLYSQTFQNTSGCDSTVNLNLTIHQPSSGDTVAIACSSFSWYGNTYTNSGNYTHTLQNAVGCDSTVTLNLTIQQTLTSDTTAITCESYTWYGTTYTQSGNYTHTLQSIYGCDSVVTMQLTISNSIQTVDIQQACNSFTWIDGNTYTQSTSTPSMTYQSVSGCDSIVTLQLTIHNSVTVNTDVTACSSFTWNGTLYSSSGLYSQTFQNASGCDSTVNLNLTIHQPSSGDTVAIACSSFSWYGTTYTNSGSYTHTLQNAVGCDSTVTLNLTIQQTLTSDTTAMTCESFTWYGTTYTQSGNYTHTLQSIYGCDSVLTLQLTISNSIQTVDIQEACNSFTWIDGNTYTQSTSTPTMTYQSVSGCDSIVTLQLTIQHSVTVDTDAVGCSSYTWNGTTYTESGTYSQTFQSVTGCDSIVNLNLTIHQPSSGDTVAIACSSFSWYGTTYVNSGNYTHTLQNAVGCDSSVTLNLTIQQVLTSDTTAMTCESFTWYGTTYTQSGNYTHTLQSIYGCDSVLTLQLTISNSIQTVDIQEACNSFTWIDGNTYTQSTSTPTMTYQSVSGCDSVVTLNLTIFNPSIGDTLASACEQFTWYGIDLTTSGVYSHTLVTNNGCDSVVFLNLTIHQSTAGDTTAVACGSFDWYGNTFTTSGDYQHLLLSSAGCDSLVTLHLTINPFAYAERTVESCGSYIWYGEKYINSGDYTISVPSGLACDSIITLHLTVVPKPIASFTADKIETEIVDPNFVLFNHSQNATYYVWDFGDGNLSTDENPIHTYDDHNNYVIQLVAYANSTCTDTAYLNVKINNVALVFIPNTFTPDGNEFNNIFKPIFAPHFIPNVYKLSIFNRWGELIFVSQDPKIGWDGTNLTNTIVMSGVYTYTVEFDTPEQVNQQVVGHVTLLK